MKVAVAKYAIGMPADFDAFAARQREVLAQAASAGAQVAVLPEYLSLELAATFDAAVRGDLHASLAATQAYRDAWLSFYAELARELSMFLQPGTFLTDVSKAWDMEAFAKRAEGFALRRGGEPHEIVGAALYLASDLSSYTTGSILTVDGGQP